MKVKVNKEFVDKYTQELRQVGAVLEMTKERLEEIKRYDSSFVTEIAEERKVNK